MLPGQDPDPQRRPGIIALPKNRLPRLFRDCTGLGIAYPVVLHIGARGTRNEGTGDDEP